MRKLISLIGLALMLSMLSGSVFASKYEQCDILKTGDYTRGLIGLCNAYWTAVDNGKGELEALERYRNQMGAGDPDMPGLEPPEPEPVTCPCLDALAVINDEDWGFPFDCSNDGSFDLGMFARFEDGFLTFFATDNDGISGMCSIEQSEIGDNPKTEFTLETTLDEYDVCLTELLLRCAGG